MSIRIEEKIKHIKKITSVDNKFCSISKSDHSQSNNLVIPQQSANAESQSEKVIFDKFQHKRMSSDLNTDFRKFTISEALNSTTTKVTPYEDLNPKIEIKKKSAMLKKFKTLRKKVRSNKVAIDLQTENKIYLLISNLLLKKIIEAIFLVATTFKVCVFDFKESKNIVSILIAIWIFTSYLSQFQNIMIIILVVFVLLSLIVLQSGLFKLVKKTILLTPNIVNVDWSLEIVIKEFKKFKHEFSFTQQKSDVTLSQEIDWDFNPITRQKNLSCVFLWEKTEPEAYCLFKISPHSVTFEMYGRIRLQDLILMKKLVAKLYKKTVSITGGSIDNSFNGISAEHFKIQTNSGETSPADLENKNKKNENDEKIPKSNFMKNFTGISHFEFPDQPNISSKIQCEQNHIAKNSLINENAPNSAKKKFHKKIDKNLKIESHEKEDLSATDNSKSATDELIDNRLISQNQKKSLFPQNFEKNQLENHDLTNNLQTPNFNIKNDVFFQEDIQIDKQESSPNLIEDQVCFSRTYIEEIDIFFSEKLRQYENYVKDRSLFRSCVKKEKVYEIFGRPDSKFITKMCVTKLPFNINVIFEYLKVPENNKVYNPMLDHMNLVKKYDEHHILFHMVIRSPVFVANRDFCYYFVARKISDDRFVVINFSVEDQRVPLHKRYVRGFLKRDS